jgi:anti-anti-sigma factor
MQSISLVRRPASSIAAVLLAGDFDLVHEPDIIAALNAAIADDDARLVAVDLSSVTFLDSTMLQALVRGRDRAQRVRKPVWLVRPAPIVWRVFTVTLIAQLFRDFASLEELEKYASSTERSLAASGKPAPTPAPMRPSPRDRERNEPRPSGRLTRPRG